MAQTTTNGSSKRRPVPRPAGKLFHIWHSLQDLKTEANRMRDKELVFLLGLVELAVEQRATPADASLAELDTATAH
ncbi:MAG TPA: hypothetical protein VMI56_04875 [Reyranella sp.]|nr:hypothetical protein [Reyranella sp.]